MLGRRRFAASVGEKSHYFTDGFVSHIRGWGVGVQIRASREDGKSTGSSKDQDSVSFDISATAGSVGPALTGPHHIATVSYDKKTGERKIEIEKPGVAWVMHGGHNGTSFMGIFWTLDDVKAAFPGREWSMEQGGVVHRANPTSDDPFALWADLYATNEVTDQFSQAAKRLRN